MGTNVFEEPAGSSVLKMEATSSPKMVVPVIYQSTSFHISEGCLVEAALEDGHVSAAVGKWL
jgi:hypothetical protein